jgi:hypothetical protein
MDPYLERPDRWSGVHARLIAVIGEMLARQVAPRFFVDSEDYVYILGRDDPGRSLLRPDLTMVELAGVGSTAPARGRIASPLLVAVPEELEIRTPFLKILDTLSREVVTTIEVLSPINKTPGSAGHREFLRKRKQVLGSTSHWLEIDLLRAGVRPLGVPVHEGYDAILHRARTPEHFEGWFATVRQPLPTIAVPLTAPFEDVPLPPQEVVETVYDRYRYDAAIEYEDMPPQPPFSPDDMVRLRERIAAWRQ